MRERQAHPSNQTRRNGEMLLKYHTSCFLGFRVAYKLLITKHQIAKCWRATCYDGRGICSKLPSPGSPSQRVWASTPACTVTFAWYRPRPKPASCFAALTWTISLLK